MPSTDSKLVVGDDGKATLSAGTVVKDAGSEERKTLTEGGTITSDGIVEETVTTPESTPSCNNSKPQYSVDVDTDDIDNGSVKLSSTRAKKASIVAITVTSDEGY